MTASQAARIAKDAGGIKKWGSSITVPDIRNMI